MKLSTTIAAVLFSVIARTGALSALSSRQYDPCPEPPFSTLECCKAGLPGILGINCVAPASFPTDPASFAELCSELFGEPQCCAIPVAGQELFCEAPGGL
ncbi:hypothetical protein C8R45DRAFT_835218 [Mycena sanguinolenta]|nr:hypothetical protein C8R45DRAFT_835218 [Mycena sanguinolenta]